MREAGAPSTGCCRYRLAWCARPTGGSHGLTTDAPAQRIKGAKLKAAPARSKGAARGIIKAGILHLASLQRRGLILREDCYNVVTRAPTVGNDLVVPDSKRERGVHARYALLGTRSAGGGRRPGDRLGAVPIGPPLALAARCGPGLTHGRLPRPVNVERWAG
jgi:hypothetical protein